MYTDNIAGKTRSIVLFIFLQDLYFVQIWQERPNYYNIAYRYMMGKGIMQKSAIEDDISDEAYDDR